MAMYLNQVLYYDPSVYVSCVYFSLVSQLPLFPQVKDLTTAMFCVHTTRILEVQSESGTAQNCVTIVASIIV